jgi:hypothetical protein
MRVFLTCLALTLVSAYSQAQDPGTQAAQQAAQVSTQITRQTNEQAIRDVQLANQNAMIAHQQATQNSRSSQYVAAPKLSIKTGTYSSPVTVTITADRNAAIYYTTDGWTPTADSARYVGPITIDSTTSLQAIAISQDGARSRVTEAVYMLSGGIPPNAQAVTTIPTPAPGVASNAATAASASLKLLIVRGTAVPLVFASDVNSKTAHAGDKISLTLAQDLKAGGVIVARKGTSSVGTITEVDPRHIMGVPGELFFTVDYLKVGETVIKLRGAAAKQGPDQQEKAADLMMAPLPIGVFIHGKDAEIKQGTPFTAVIAEDTVLSED